MRVLVFSIILFSSCSTTQYLGGSEHEFNHRAQRVIWLQFAGWGSDLYPLIKFRKTHDQASLLEEVSAVGTIWNYSAQAMRSKSSESFSYQMNGKAHFRNECDYFKKMPLIQKLVNEDYTLGFFQASKVKSKSIQDVIDCKIPWAVEEKSNLYFWQSFPGLSPKHSFHIEKDSSYLPRKVYTDQSCSGNQCFKKKVENIISVFDNQLSKKRRFLFMVRDDSLIQTSKSADLKERLNEQLAMIDYFIQLTKKDPDLLVLITGAEPTGLEYPKQGKQWQLMDRSGRYLKYDESRLLSSALAIGASSEIFAGIYKDQDIQLKLSWAIEGL